MNSTQFRFHRTIVFSFSIALLLSAATGCKRAESPQTKRATPINVAESVRPAPERIVLAPLGGDTSLDRQIERAQAQVRATTNRAVALEKLGWLFIKKARTSFDSGYYRLAEQCALAMKSLRPGSAEALFLRGYALENLHHFKDAEAVARKLVASRGRSFDYGLLGDALMEQGQLDEAVEVYQQMADIKPDLHAYTRAAHVRWLKGDLTGAIEMMRMAEEASTPRDPESAAWVYARMALYQLQAGDFEQCRLHCDAALQFQKDYAPALLVRGQLLLAQGRFPEAIKPLALAAKLNPVPQYQWTLADALRTAHETNKAEAVERELKARGAATDPRTFALYLATRGEDVRTAVSLAEAELDTRRDVLTHDVLARALAAAGRWNDAEKEIQLALAQGTQDARLFLHAGIVARELSRTADANTLFAKATALQQMLLPSERAQLKQFANPISRIGADTSQTKTKNHTNTERS